MDRHVINDREDWRRQLRGNSLPWLLQSDTPAVRHLTLRDRLGRPSGDPEVADARALAFLGAGIAALTRRPAWYGALRQVCLGAVAAGFTYAVGLLIGVGAP